MSARPYPFLLILSLWLSILSAQTAHFDFGFERNADIPVVENGSALSLPWCGGLNSVHFSEIDLDMDGVTDLLGFEKHGNRVLPFLRDGDHYRYAPPFPRAARLGLAS